MSRKGLMSRLGGRLFASAIEERAADLAKLTLKDMQWGSPGLMGSRQLASASGVDVSEEETIGLPAVWRALDAISGSMGMLPLILYERDGEEKRRAREHPLYGVLRNVAYPELLTAMSFKSQIQAQALLFGNGFARVFRDRSGFVTALWPLWPPNMKPALEIREGRPWYVYMNQGKAEYLAPRAVFHLAGMTLWGCFGISPVGKCRDSLGSALALVAYASGFFSNGAWLGGAFMIPGDAPAMSPEEFREHETRIREKHSGLENAFKPILLRGMKWESTGVSPENAQALESRVFSVQDVARIFGIPPSYLMDLTHSTKSNAEQQALQFKAALLPWGERWAQQIGMTLLSDRERKTFFADFIWEKLVQADLKTKADSYNMEIQSGLSTPDELRARDNRNPLADGQGAKARFPVNAIPADRADDYGEKVVSDGGGDFTTGGTENSGDGEEE